MWEFFKIAEQKRYRSFFYGDTQETLERLVLKLKENFPDLQIAGIHSPPYHSLTPEEEARDLEMLNESGADVVWVGLGLPKQEKWMNQFRDQLNVPVIVGVGASFKFLSGQVKRAPSVVGNFGFEWLWRFLHEPRRLWRRVLIDGPRFVAHVMLELSGLKCYD